MRALRFLAGSLITAGLFTVAACSYKEDVSQPAVNSSSVGEVKQEVAVVPDSVTVKDQEWLLIATEEQLRAIGQTDTYPLDARYMLQSDITLSKDVDWVPIGTRENPFTGVVNGNGFEIIDLTITNKEVNPLGFVAYAEGAKIYNVVLRNVDYMGAFCEGDRVGAFVVFSDNTCEIFDNKLIDFIE